MSYTLNPPSNTIQPVIVSYYALNMTASVTLYWPTAYYNTPYVVPGYLDITSTNSAFTITMPDATQVSVGPQSVFQNKGSVNVSVLKSDGSPLITIAPTQAILLKLTNNSNAAGTWETIDYGAGSATANANALAGYGLVVLNAPADTTKLNGSWPVKIQSTSYTILYSDRCSVLISQGGDITYTLPLSTDSTINGALGNGYMVAARKNGTGALTIQVTPSSGDTINGVANFVLNPGTDVIIVYDGNHNYYTLGYSELQLTNVLWPSGSIGDPGVRFIDKPSAGMGLDESGGQKRLFLGSDGYAIAYFMGGATEGTGHISAQFPIRAPAGSSNYCGIAIGTSNNNFWNTGIWSSGSGISTNVMLNVNGTSVITATTNSITTPAYLVNSPGAQYDLAFGYMTTIGGTTYHSGIYFVEGAASYNGTYITYNSVVSAIFSESKVSVASPSSTKGSLSLQAIDNIGAFDVAIINQAHAANRNYQLLDVGSPANFVMDQGTITQNLAGNYAFLSPIKGGGSPAQVAFDDPVIGNGGISTAANQNITSGGNLICSTIGTGLQIKIGSTDQRIGKGIIGQAPNDPGKFVFTSANITNNTLLLYSVLTPVNLGTWTVTETPGNITITSSNTNDQSKFSYQLIEMIP